MKTIATSYVWSKEWNDDATEETGILNDLKHLSTEDYKTLRNIPDVTVTGKGHDDELFQTGRLITCGLYVNSILKDYVRAILNLDGSGSTRGLDPRMRERRSAYNSAPATEVTGNQITENVRCELGRGVDPAEASVDEVRQALAGYQRTIPGNSEERGFAGLRRGDDRAYSDDNLVGILRASIEDVAGAFGANPSPQCAQGDRGLMALYDSPDAVELYPGPVSEKPRPPTSGSGLCVNVTTSRANLSDVVSLVRGDRLYTTDYTPVNVTNLDNEADFDLKLNQGHVSVYAHFPFAVSSENRVILDALGTSEKYFRDKPARKMDPVVTESHKAVGQVLDDNKDFHVLWGVAISYLVSPLSETFGRDFCLASDESASQASRAHVDRCLYQPERAAGDHNRAGSAVPMHGLLPRNRGRAPARSLPPRARENSAPADEELMHMLTIEYPLTQHARGHPPPGHRSSCALRSAHQRPQEITDDVPCLYDSANPSGLSPIRSPPSSRAASSRTFTLAPGQRAIIDLVTASQDTAAFPAPETLRLDRPLASYPPWGLGPRRCLGEGMTLAALAAFKVLVELPGFARAPGAGGECRSEFMERHWQAGRKAVAGGGAEWAGLRVYLTPEQGAYSPVADHDAGPVADAPAAEGARGGGGSG
ncbi:hypothetical protein DL769_005353 [Monosporascus sp. CRB-8-3]|nr:hypothetical protein DL769_005353 [Monosporascus sp. CRB-8-3]